MAILNPTIIGEAIGYQLAAIVDPVPVYAVFNRNFATEPKFVVWQLMNVHQPTYTGQQQQNLGINTPMFQISVFTQKIEDGFNISNEILQSLHGYSGTFGDPAGDGFFVAKADVIWQYNSYDNEENLAQIFMDCRLYLPT
jgi:hypothetical protein